MLITRGTREAVELDAPTSAAVRAVHHAGADAHLDYTRDDTGQWEISLGGVRLGWVRRASYGSGWHLVNLGLAIGRTTHRTRGDAAVTVAADLARLAAQARPATRPAT